MAEATGGRTRARTLRPGFVVVGIPTERRAVGTSGRAPYQRRPPGHLTDAERRAIRVLASSRSLRDLAADFGVSHETIRGVLQLAKGQAASRKVLNRAAC